MGVRGGADWVIRHVLLLLLLLLRVPLVAGVFLRLCVVRVALLWACVWVRARM